MGPRELTIGQRSRRATTDLSRWAALPVLMAGTFMIVLDFFIVNVALPSIQSELRASASAIEWVVAGYGLTFAVFIITAGRIGDQFGRRRVFATGLAAFTLASAGCALATSATMLIAFRLLQGSAAALIGPSVLSIIGVIYTGPDRARAISVYAMVLGLAAAGGQLVGGLLIRADIFDLGWRAVFLINLPIGAVAFVLVRHLVPESRAERAKRLDLAGVALVIAGFTALVLPLIQGRQQGWPAWTWLSLGAAPLILGSFALYQRRLSRHGGAPLIDLELFRARTFTAGLLAQLALYGGLASFFLVLALYLQQGRGLSAMQAGLVFTILAVAYLLGSLRAPALTTRHGRRLVAAGGLLLAGGHGVLLAAVVEIGARGSLALLAPGLAVIGLGMGLCVTPITTIVLSHADPQRAGTVSGILSTTQQIGNALGVAVTGVIFFGRLGHGSSFSYAFALSLAELCLLAVALAVLTRLMPDKAG